MFFLRSQLNRCLVNQINNHINPIRSSRRASCFVNADRTPNDDPDNEFEQLIDDPLYDEFKSNFLFRNRNLERAYVIQPWIKWGPDKLWNTTAELMLDETATLTETVPRMQVIQKEVITSTTFKRPLVFGKGNVQRIAEQVQNSGQIDCLVIGLNMLNGKQQQNLEQQLGIKVYDRYSIVLRIFNERACTKEARLQTALAEIPYIRARLQQMHENRTRYGTMLKQVGGSVDMYLTDRKDILRERERKLRKQLLKIEQAKDWQLQTRQQKLDIPIVAVVGYTNCGKTSLIRYLTKDESLIPLDQLFATLDVTYHKGRMDSGQSVFFMDTIGFISNIPTGLISAFNASLKEIHQAHAIVHVYDVSHPDLELQKRTVHHTLNELIGLPDKLRSTVLNVGNKIDLLKDPLLVRSDGDQTEDAATQDLMISVTELINVKPLKDLIEQRVNDSFGRSRHTLRIRSGGPEYGWLMKNAVIMQVEVDEQDANYMLIDVQILPKLLNKAIHSYPNMKLYTKKCQPEQNE